MVELNNTFRLARTAVFATTSLFALIVIILSGLVTNFSDGLLGGFFSFAALGIATGVITLLTLPVMLALSMVRKGVFTSMIALEIGWTWFLWIMWIAVGGNSATGLLFFGSCSRFAGVEPGVQAACNEASAIAAFGFLSWIMLLSYCAFLSTVTFRQHLRGNTGIWTKDVTETDFTAAGPNYNNNPQIVYGNKDVYANQYPPTGTPQAGVPYQAGSQYQSPQAPGVYTQPQGATGSFTHLQGQTGPSPYPQV